jgi:hypothetical protein
MNLSYMIMYNAREVISISKQNGSFARVDLITKAR